MSKESIGKIISAVTGLIVLGFAVYLLSQDHEQGNTALLAGLAILGAVGTVALPRVNEPRQPTAPRRDDKGVRHGS